ncbi:hypothetical protein ACHAXT_013121 [Thalassiosira profunda]
MKIAATAVSLLAALPGAALAQECLLGGFEFEFDGSCTPESVLAAYEEQVFGAAGATSDACTLDAAADLNLKLAAANIADLQALCDSVYNSQEQVPFTEAAKRGDDMHFEREFFNGRTDWQEEVETIYESEDGTRTSVLNSDAEQVRAFFEGVAQGRRVEWPGVLPNFQSSVTDGNDLATCTTNAAMCCWPKDRQAGDGNGNCATPYDKNCVDKNPADNTNLCYVDLDRGNSSTGYNSGSGIVSFPEDNGNGEGAIHCHGLAWSNDKNDHTARYKANGLFFVSMYDHMYQRGYVENIPGAPMCGCVEQMPTVSRSDCTQVDLTETIKISYSADTNTFVGKMTHIHVDFNACQGINNRNNDLWAYMARLYYQEDVTPQQFGELGRIITNTGCKQATRYELNKHGMTRGYDHDVSMWTKVAGRDDMYDGHPFGKAAFDAAFWEGSLTKPLDMEVAEFPVGQTPILHRICPGCTDTHKNIYYRRKTPITNCNLLKHIVYQRGNDCNGQNKWNVDFSLHSTYEDAVSGDNPWQCPGDAFNYWAPFYGECSPSGAKVRDQYSIWSWFPGPQSDVAYYVNKPEGEGIQELDLTQSTRFHAGHTDVDLGDVGIPGRTFENDDGSIHISGSGWDIWNTNDMGHYFSDLTTGDVDVSVHVSSFTNIRHGYAKAGIMLRSNNDDDATNVFALLSGSNGVGFQKRSSKGKYSETIGSYHKTTPIQTSAWLRVVKKMETVECYRSDDGIEWVLHASTNILFPDDTFRVGLAVTSHDDRHVSEATFEDYSTAAYEFPSAAPSLSSAPTAWDAIAKVGEAPSPDGSTWSNADGSITYHRGYGYGITPPTHSDSFFFDNVQRDASTPFDVVTYVHRFHTGYQTARGGIMIRNSNDADAANAFLGMTGYYNGLTFQSRATAGVSTDHHQTTYIPHHQAWIRLSSDGSGLITAYYKIDVGDEWIEFGSATIDLAGTLNVGTAVTAGYSSGDRYADLETKSFSIA